MYFGLSIMTDNQVTVQSGTLRNNENLTSLFHRFQKMNLPFLRNQGVVDSTKVTDIQQAVRHSYIYNNLTELIGQTPIMSLKLLFPDNNVMAKLENFNPLGSIKDRVALHVIRSGIATGLINSDTVVIESTSGNFGVGLSFVCKFYGLKFIAVVDPKISPTNLQLLKLRGAQIDMVKEPDETGNYLSKRIQRVQELREEIPNSFWPCQYSSPENPRAHYYGAGEEIIYQLNGAPLDYFMTAISTTGTMTGISRRLQESYPYLNVIAVDEEGSCLFGGAPAPRCLNGMGAGHPLPDLAVKAYEQKIANQVIRVTAKEAIQGCYDLLEAEGIMVGGSGGAVIAALRKFLPTISPDSRILVVFADRGERYLNSFYDEQWVEAHT